LRTVSKVRGIRCGLVRRKDGYNTWHVVVSNIEGVVKMAKRMLPCAVKKTSELNTVMDHFGDGATADEFLETMNSLVLAEKEPASIEATDLSFTDSRGLLESRRVGEQSRLVKRTLT
jgi:hypothetical protein